MPLRVLLGLASSLTLLLLAPPISAQAGKYEFRVVNVARSDFLNVRERVSDQDSISAAKILAQIPARTDGVLGSGASQLVGRTRWFEIRYGETRGWVNGRFLSPKSSQLDGELESNLFCAGTEPFWSLKIEDNSAEMRRPDQQPEQFSIAVREPFQGREDALAIRIVNDMGPEISALVQHKEWCSDGMSDLEYAFQVRLVGREDGGEPLRGCCSLLR